MIPGCGKILVKMIHKRVALRCHSYCFGRERERYSQMGNPGAPRDPADGAVWGTDGEQLQITNYALQICPQGKAPGRRKGIVRKQFTFYESFYDALVKLPTEQAQKGAWVITTYALTGRMPDEELEPALDVAFTLIKPVLDSARKKSQGAVNSHKNRKSHKENSQSADRIPSGYAQDTVREKELEKEVEKEVEVEVEVEIEKELEKESLLHMGSVPLMCVRDCFDKFWDAYPLKLAKKQAWLAWKKDEPDLDTVMTALDCWKRSRKWNSEQGRYIPRGDKFLEERHYLDIPKDTVPMGASGHLGMAEMEAIENLMRG